MHKTDIKEALPPIHKKKIILAEGKDAYLFLIHLMVKKGIDDIQVMDSRGVVELTTRLKSLMGTEGFEDVTSVLIFRDSELSTKSAIQSVNYSLKSIKLIAKEIEPFTISQQNSRKIGFVLFPGFDETGNLYDQGTLEDLCINLFNDTSISEIIKKYIDNYQKSKGIKFSHKHKNELHAILSFTDKYVGMKIGETAKAGGFNFDSTYFEPFLKMIKEM